MRLSDCLGFCVCGMKVSDRMFTMNMCEYFLCKSLATKVKLSEVRLQKCVCVRLALRSYKLRFTVTLSPTVSDVFYTFFMLS